MRFFGFRPLLDKFGQKNPKQTGKKTKQKQKKNKNNHNCQFKLKFGTWKINGGVHFFCFRQQTLFLGKFGPKNQSRQLKTAI